MKDINLTALMCLGVPFVTKLRHLPGRGRGGIVLGEQTPSVPLEGNMH
jgi:hypothetical protein